ncbi:hypothetical protein AGMMS50212_13600 [Spirochaetia bacterium]|nr:hypothetical protein AGMMS50212_13600 [Spirochaetia bacterium]
MELLIRSLPITKRQETKRRAGVVGEKELKILETILQTALKKFSNLQGFILDCPAALDDYEKIGFHKIVGGQIASFGHAIRLPSLRVLVLLPVSVDGALVAHRLCGNLQVTASVFFEADNVNDILELVKVF